MRLHLLLVPLLLAMGCVRTVRVEVPALPAVDIDDPVVAVVAVDRECRETADSLVHALDREGFTVDPRATLRLHVHSCGSAYETLVDVEQMASRDAVMERRRAQVMGRHHAMLMVTSNGKVQANLIASSEKRTVGAWAGEIGDTLQLRTAAQRQLHQGVATDLASQVSPMPRTVARKVYVGTSRLSARRLHNLAVRAEIRGDLEEARELAHRAWEADPREAHLLYVQELERLIEQLEQR